MPIFKNKYLHVNIFSQQLLAFVVFAEIYHNGLLIVNQLTIMSQGGKLFLLHLQLFELFEDIFRYSFGVTFLLVNQELIKVNFQIANEVSNRLSPTPEGEVDEDREIFVFGCLTHLSFKNYLSENNKIINQFYKIVEFIDFI